MKKLILTNGLIGFENGVYQFFETLEYVKNRISELNNVLYIEHEYRINKIFEENICKPIGYIQDNLTFYALYESEKNNITFVSQSQIDFLMNEFNLDYNQVLKIIKNVNAMK